MHLEATKNSSTYRHRLREGMARFLQFLERRRVVCDWWLDVMLVNQLLVDLINEMHEEKVAICHARHCILAVQTAHRNLKGCLGRAWDCLKAWQLRQPSWSRVPIPILILRTMFAAALLQAQAEPTAQWYCFAVLIRLGFAGLLRPIELMKLRAEDVRLPQSDWEPRVVVLRLVEPKNKSCLGRYQFTTIDEPELVSWLGWLVAGLPPDAHIWPGSQALFTKHWKRIITLLGIGRLGLTPGSLRPGGATAHFLLHKSIAALRIAGRWRAESSLEHYIQLTMAHLCLCQLSSSEHEYASELSQLTLPQWSAPPNRPWTAVFSRARQWQALARIASKQSSTTSQAASKACAQQTLAQWPHPQE